MVAGHDDLNNIWDLSDATAIWDKTGSAVTIEIIEDVHPLDDQFRCDPKKTVPDVLLEALFGQPEPTAAEIAVAGENAGKVLPMQTYAILDAAKVTNLPEMLEASELAHFCLFQGDAYEQLSGVAPWIVALEKENNLSRHIFTRGDAPWAMWDKEPGIYIRSRAPIEIVRRHFRKFTRVQDETGKWFYFRFWECRYARLHLERAAKDPQRARHWFQIDAQNSVTLMLADPKKSSFTIFRPAHQVGDRSNKPFLLDANDHYIFATEKKRQFMERLGVFLQSRKGYFATLADKDREAWLNEVIHEAKHFSITLEKAVADFAEACSILQGSPKHNHFLLRHLQSPRHELDRARLVLDGAKKQLIGASEP